jgi:hypothetical protein
MTKPSYANAQLVYDTLVISTTLSINETNEAQIITPNGLDEDAAISYAQTQIRNDLGLDEMPRLRDASIVFTDEHGLQIS